MMQVPLWGFLRSFRDKVLMLSMEYIFENNSKYHHLSYNAVASVSIGSP